MNNFHIARNVWPELSFLEEHHRLICSSCKFCYDERWIRSGCRRALGSGKRCDGSFCPPSVMLSPSTPLHNNLSPSASQFISVPSSTVSVICNSNNSNDSDIVNNDNNIHISTCLPPHDLVLAGVQAAASISPPLVYESLIFSSVMCEIFTLPVSTISHVPRKVRPFLAQVITTELQHAHLDGLWGFTRLSLFPKAVLRPPSRGGRKKRYAVDALIVSRIRRWQDGDLEARSSL